MALLAWADSGDVVSFCNGNGIWENVGLAIILVMGKGDVLEKELFIPLKREYYEAFRKGEKKTEYRKYGPRWNANTGYEGRRVVLSLGYGRKHRLFGKIIWAFKEDDMKFHKGYQAIYGDVPAWCMEIEIKRDFNERELDRKDGQ